MLELDAPEADVELSDPQMAKIWKSAVPIQGIDVR